MEFTFLFLNLDKIQIFIPKSTKGEVGSADLGIIPKKTFFFFNDSLTIIPGQSVMLTHWVH